MLMSIIFRPFHIGGTSQNIIDFQLKVGKKLKMLCTFAIRHMKVKENSDHTLC